MSIKDNCLNCPVIYDDLFFLSSVTHTANVYVAVTLDIARDMAETEMKIQIPRFEWNIEDFSEICTKNAQ